MRLNHFVILAGVFWLLTGAASRADDTNSPNELWQLKLPFNGGVSSCALAPDGTIYEATFQGLVLAVTSQGEVKWKFKAGREIWSSPAIADDGTIYFGSRDHNFYALTPDGKLKWQFTTGGWVDSSPAIAPDGTVYFGSWDKNFYALTPGGKLKWTFATSNLITSSPALAADGTIYFGSHDAKFYALTPDGKLKWSFGTGAEIDGSPAIGADGTVYIPSTDGNLYALRPDGSLLWKYHTGGYTASQPVIDEEGSLYLAIGRDQIVLSRDGKRTWWHPTDVPLDMSWALTANGMVYMSMPWLSVGCIDRKHDWPPVWYYHMQFNLATSPTVGPDGTVYVADTMHLYAFKPRDASPLLKSPWPMWRANPQHNGRAQVVK